MCRVAEWVAGESDRNRQRTERKKRRQQKLLEEPRHTFDDSSYMDAIRSTEEGMAESLKRGLQQDNDPSSSSSLPPAKKAKLWYVSPHTHSTVYQLLCVCVCVCVYIGCILKTWAAVLMMMTAHHLPLLVTVALVRRWLSVKSCDHLIKRAAHLQKRGPLLTAHHWESVLPHQHHRESVLPHQHHRESVLSHQHHRESVLPHQHHRESVLSHQHHRESVLLSAWRR